MNRTAAASLARTALDEQFADVHRYALTPPPRGWVRALRDALGMTASQLGGRLGISSSAIVQLEQSEVHGTAQLATLRRLADALECELVYALIPRTSLADTVQRQAERQATRFVARANQTMRLEDQGLTATQLQRQIDDLVAQNLNSPALWDESTT
jgi:predicted DNA-binding mobile mystery protein A